jgi:GNAT superfamily N-acetyltransferase
MSTPNTPVAATGHSLQWVPDLDPRWDADKERVLGSVPAGVFRALERPAGERLPGDWWQVVADGRVVAYGWLDDVWGDAEVLLAVEEGSRGTGVGRFLLAHLEQEAAVRGLNYVTNVVQDTHPDRRSVTDWFCAHGFTGADDGRLRKRVAEGGDPGQRQAGRPGARRAPAPDAGTRERYEAERARAPHGTAGGRAGASGPDRGPGHEESGGYVDVEEHRY